MRKRILLLLPFHRELDRLAAQQAVDLVDVGLHVLYLDGAKAHRSPRGEARADAEVDAARRKLVQCRQRIGGDRGNAVRRHQHACAEADTLGVHGRRAHGDETIGAQHLGVVEPSMGEAELLGFLGDLPGICSRW